MSGSVVGHRDLSKMVPVIHYTLNYKVLWYVITGKRAGIHL
jgi:hypothetical protein